MKRVIIFLVATFAITWPPWWTLARTIPPGGGPFTSPAFLTVYLLGGFGPTIGAGIAVVATRADGFGREYLSRLLRWRVSPLWWLAAFAVPPLVAAAREWIAIGTSGGGVTPSALEPLAKAAALFPTMIIGGGLEELGWRGVAQPEFERRAPRLVAALIVGVFWALWHLPLFFIPGVAQFGGDFRLFGVDVIANACFLAWVYAGTRSILLCVIFHAASNTATAVGLSAASVLGGSSTWIASATVLAASLLLLIFGRMPTNRSDGEPTWAR